MTYAKELLRLIITHMEWDGKWQRWTLKPSLPAGTRARAAELVGIGDPRDGVVPALHEEREHDVICCCGDHLRPDCAVGEPDWDVEPSEYEYVEKEADDG